MIYGQGCAVLPEAVGAGEPAGMGVSGRVEAMLPLSQTATNRILSNVSPVMTDKVLCRELFSHGKIVSRGESHDWI